MDQSLVTYISVAYGSYVAIALVNIWFCRNSFVRSRRIPFIVMGFTNFSLIMESIFEISSTVYSYGSDVDQDLENALTLIGILFTRFSLILYMWVVVNRLYLIRFLWKGLRTWHCVLLYFLDISLWSSSIIFKGILTYVSMNDYNGLDLDSTDIDFLSYGIIILTTLFVDITVIRILDVKRKILMSQYKADKTRLNNSYLPNSGRNLSEKEGLKLLHTQKAILVLFCFSTLCFVLSLIFWMVPNYDVIDDPNGAFINSCWIISYATTALHFTFDIFLQEKFSQQLEATTSHYKVEAKDSTSSPNSRENCNSSGNGLAEETSRGKRISLKEKSNSDMGDKKKERLNFIPKGIKTLVNQYVVEDKHKSTTQEGSQPPMSVDISSTSSAPPSDSRTPESGVSMSHLRQRATQNEKKNLTLVEGIEATELSSAKLSSAVTSAAATEDDQSQLSETNPHFGLHQLHSMKNAPQKPAKSKGKNNQATDSDISSSRISKQDIEGDDVIGDSSRAVEVGEEDLEFVVNRVTSTPRDTTIHKQSRLSHLNRYSRWQPHHVLGDNPNAEYFVAESAPTLTEEHMVGTCDQQEMLHEAMLQRQEKRARCHCCGVDIWKAYTMLVTFWIPPFVLRIVGRMKDRRVQHAWREKIALMSIVVLLSLATIFVFVYLPQLLCPNGNSNIDFDALMSGQTSPKYQQGMVIIRGKLYSFLSALTYHEHVPLISPNDTFYNTMYHLKPVDVTPFFPPAISQYCIGLIQNGLNPLPECNMTQISPDIAYCHDPNMPLSNFYVADIAISWNDIVNSKNLMVFNGDVINLQRYLSEGKLYFGKDADQLIRSSIGIDASFRFTTANQVTLGRCLSQIYKIGIADGETTNCMLYQVLQTITMVVIFAVLIARFTMAFLFQWFMAKKLGRLADERKKVSSKSKSIGKRIGISKKNLLRGVKASMRNENKEEREEDTSSQRSSSSNQLALAAGYKANSASTSTLPILRDTYQVNSPSLIYSQENHSTTTSLSQLQHEEDVITGEGERDPEQAWELRDIYVVLLVTCYSEDEDGLRLTLDSLACSEYNDQQKLLFIVADGIITGSGNSKSTPDIVLSMIERLPLENTQLPDHIPYSYISIGEGPRRQNRAKVYAGYYVKGDHRVPTVVVIKCGTEEEVAEGKKPGNRGKRDSQIILMSFFHKVLFDSYMTPLDFVLFKRIMRVTGGITPDKYEVVLMVDADTKVALDSLGRMIACMAWDDRVIGLCGETRIANKRESWVTAIQVFEYYISHHLAKAFESVFGGVTCLPGCFCMYRLKAPKDRGNFWAPILCDPNVITEYSQSKVESLHQKNLLLLGEDRFLSTMMLRMFPTRKIVFVPMAVCHTFVPSKFKVLLSQRRRWINSTVHNLMELVLIPELCGIFCFSMQFIVFMELLGTVILPVAIVFTFVFIANMAKGFDLYLMPFILLMVVLFLPAVLILLTTGKVIYLTWMGYYLLALPIWNFVFPLYSFWHFDDFSWGQTRQVEGEKASEARKGHHHVDGKNESEKGAKYLVPLRKYADYELERVKRASSYKRKRP